MTARSPVVRGADSPAWPLLWLVSVRCRMKRLFIAGSCGAFLLIAAAAVEAQSTPDFTRCTTANFLGGVSFANDDQTGVLGGAVGWELKPRLNIEATTRWQVPKNGVDAFAVTFTAQLPLLSRRTFVPFVAGGMGVYSASFDSGSTAIPEFYSQRMTPPGVPSGPTERFTDPAFVFGGGVSIFAAKHVSLRPEVETIWVRRDGMNHFVTSASVRFAYHFELHRITAQRRQTQEH